MFPARLKNRRMSEQAKAIFQCNRAGPGNPGHIRTDYRCLTLLLKPRKSLQTKLQRLQELGETLREEECYLRTIILSEPECVKLHEAHGTSLCWRSIRPVPR
jgi:hypothetical protein